MPFKSQAQRNYMYATKPAMAKKFSSETPKGKKLPARVNKVEARKSALSKMAGGY